MQLDWIDEQAARMQSLVEQWAHVNSGSYNLGGLNTMHGMLMDEFAVLRGELRSIDLPPAKNIDWAGNESTTPVGDALSIRMRPDAPLRVLLCIHYDTVYSAGHPFQQVTRVDDNTIRGPGVTDAKGGLVILLHALQAFEQSEHASKVGWEVLINPDEEIGSPVSTPLLHEAAKRNHFGMLYEPTLEDGSFAGARRGSGYFTLVVRGRAAHVGRNPDQGRNAIHLLADVIRQVAELNESIPGATISVGKIEGGGAVNVVPDLAICRLNARVDDVETQKKVEAAVREIAETTGALEGFEFFFDGQFYSPPKPLTEQTLAIFDAMKACGEQLDVPVRWRDTGGVCDGNRLAAAGLPNVDTLGARGGGIHSDREFLALDSLVERAKLSALLLLRLADGSWRPDWID